MNNLFYALNSRGFITTSLPNSCQLEQDISTLRHFNEADVIIINGEGTLHHGAPYAHYLLSLGHQAKKAGKKVWLINTTWESNPDDMINLIKDFDGIWVRDRHSLEQINKHIPHVNYAPDLTFAYPHQVNKAQKKPYFIATDSVYTDYSDKLFAMSDNTRFRYIPIIQMLPESKDSIGFDAKKLRKHKLYRLLTLISFGLYQPRRYYQDLNLALDNPQQYWQAIADSQGVLAARYHAVCFALQLKCPFIAISSNTPKVESLLRDVGLDIKRHTISLQALDSLNDQAIALEHAQYSTNEIERLEYFLAFAQREIKNMFDSIKEATL